MMPGMRTSGDMTYTKDGAWEGEGLGIHHVAGTDEECKAHVYKLDGVGHLNFVARDAALAASHGREVDPLQDTDIYARA